ncbi:MAG: radical SAM protein [Nitrospirae bacterium]|nr:radical SAM protein [Nitrospirota bacterium]MCL5976697.1 radical SAM protein [Nitrospirota bacterium]
MPYHEIGFFRSTVNKLKAVGVNPKYAAYRLKWNLLGKTSFLTRVPTHVDIETASACNLRCTMCPHGDADYKMEKGIIEFGLAKKIIEECSDIGVSSLKLSGRGEALMHPKLIDMVETAKTRGIMDVMFNTNGLLLTEEKAKGLVEAGIDLIIISVDGATKETYEAIRIGSDYETVRRNIEFLVRYRGELRRKKPMIRLQFVKMKENIHEFETFKNQWRDKVDVLVSIDYSNRVKQESKGVDDKKSLGRSYCPHPWRRLTVTAAGKALMCCVDWDGKYIVGDCSMASIKDIWHGPRITFGRKCIKGLEHEKISSCRECFSPISYRWK